MDKILYLNNGEQFTLLSYNENYAINYSLTLIIKNNFNLQLSTLLNLFSKEGLENIVIREGQGGKIIYQSNIYNRVENAYFQSDSEDITITLTNLEDNDFNENDPMFLTATEIKKIRLLLEEQSTGDNLI